MHPQARREFVWTDDEAELLLNITIEYKTSKAAESVDWESVKCKYADIFELFKAQLPGDGREERNAGDFPHKPEEITKQVMTSKLKAIRLKYRQAVDSGKKGVNMVELYYCTSNFVRKCGVVACYRTDCGRSGEYRFV